MKTKGVKAAKVNFEAKYATIKFDEKAISAQEVARAMSVTPHMMGRGMQYGGTLMLGVAGVKDEATAKEAKAALGKIEGVEVKLYPQKEAVGIDFAGKGKVTTKLIEALKMAGVKATQYSMPSTPSEPSGQATNGRNRSMPEHAGMRMDDRAMAAMVHRMACCCGGCGCCR